jgi:hypothetical protein
MLKDIVKSVIAVLVAGALLELLQSNAVTKPVADYISKGFSINS